MGGEARRREGLCVSARSGWPGLHSLPALDQLTEGGSSAFFKACDRATQIATDAELLRQALTAAVGIHGCNCGQSFEFPADATLNDYAALNRWVGYHSRCDQ